MRQYRKQARKGKPLLVAEMLREYEASGDGTFHQKPMWRIGYLCAMRDAGLLTWDQWNSRIYEVHAHDQV